jgi:hypothetical protein
MMQLVKALSEIVLEKRTVSETSYLHCGGAVRLFRLCNYCKKMLAIVEACRTASRRQEMYTLPIPLSAGLLKRIAMMEWSTYC